MASKKSNESIVRAISSFMDARTGRYYHPGDVVVGWEAERAQRYAEEGLVEVIGGSASRDADTSLKRPDGASASKPGPSQTKPKSGGTSKKGK